MIQGGGGSIPWHVGQSPHEVPWLVTCCGGLCFGGSCPPARLAARVERGLHLPHAGLLPSPQP